MLVAPLSLCWLCWLCVPPQGDLIDPFATRPDASAGAPGEAEPGATGATAELRDPWAVPPREAPAGEFPSDLIDPFAVPPRHPRSSLPPSDLKNPFAKAHAAAGRWPETELKDPFAASRRRP